MLVQAAPVDELITHVYYRVADQSCRHVIQQLGLTDVIGNHYYLNSDYHVNPLTITVRLSLMRTTLSAWYAIIPIP